MITKRDRNERGPTKAGWLKSMHSFSFGHYFDPEHMGYSALRVINEDRVIPAAGFGTHGHDNMEIISYVLDGELAHKDSMGTGSTIKRGDIQLMSAGTGITHSEYNGSQDKDVHFLQIWITPKERGIKPSYQQMSLKPANIHNRFGVVISPDGEEDTLQIHQDAKVFIGQFDQDTQTNFNANPERKYWLQVAHGQGTVNNQTAKSGDGFAIENEKVIDIKAMTDAEILLFELP